MRRVATTLALALILAGCDSEVPPADRVELAIAQDMEQGCYLNWAVYDLVADPTHGVAVRYGNGSTQPVYWHMGYTGRRVGSEVEVRDPSGNVVATTGRNYKIWPGFVRQGADDPRFMACAIDPPPENSAP
jgi:hypothetical protein